MPRQRKDFLQKKNRPFLTHPRTSLRSSKVFGGILLSTFFCFTLPPEVVAEQTSTEEWNITADKILHFENPQSIVAIGNVILEKKEKKPLHVPKKETGLSSWAELLEEEPSDTEMTAEEIENLPEPQYQTTVTVKADWIAYDMEKKNIKAKGNLSIATAEDTLKANEGTLNLEEETGEFKEATIVRQDDDLHLEGALIAKTGFNTYRIRDGWAITCKLEDGETPPWSIASSNTRITPGGYAVLSNARFRIRNVPVFYSPYFIVPVKSTRQTGLLFPEFSYSSNGGFGAGVPLFINLSDSADLTLYPTYFVDRGVMAGAEFRYTTSEENKGMFIGNYLDDDLSDPSEVEYYSDTGYTHTNQERYWVRGKADHTFGDGWISRLDLDLVSDEDYLREFDFGTTGFDNTQDRYVKMFGRGFENDLARTRKNSYNILKSWGGISLEGELLAIDDLNPTRKKVTTTVTDNLGNMTSSSNIVSNSSVLDGTTFDPETGTTTTVSSKNMDTPLWKLPELKFDGTLDSGFADVTFDWDTSYVHYWRDEGVGGSRIDVRPSLSTPIRLTPYLESRAKLSVRNTFYSIQENGDAEWENDSSINRFYPELELNLATTMQRDFGLDNPLRHEVRPFVKYFYIPEISNEDKMPQWDDIDTITELNRITYGVDNLISKVREAAGGMEDFSTKASLLIEQSYDIENDSDDEPFSDIYSKLSWTPVAGTSLHYKTYYDVYDNQFNRHDFEGVYSFGNNSHIGTEYSYNRANDLEQINTWGKTRLFERWYLAGRYEYSLSAEETNEARGILSYRAQCWSVNFETKYTPEDTTYMVFFELANIGTALGVGL